MAEENEIDLENPAIKAAIATAVEASVSGLKTKNSELLGKLKETSGNRWVLAAHRVPVDDFAEQPRAVTHSDQSLLGFLLRFKWTGTYSEADHRNNRKSRTGNCFDGSLLLFFVAAGS